MRWPVEASAFVLFVSTSFIAPASAKAPPEPPPLVRMVAPPPIQVVEKPQSWNYGSWETTDMGDFTLASTVNESGSAFGMACGKSCVWFVNFQTECEVGKDYPAMINSAAGASAIELRCYRLSNRWLLTYAMENHDGDTMAKGGEIGFAFPLQSGKFGVSRFSLRGGVEATVKAINLAAQKREQNQEGLKDFTI